MVAKIHRHIGGLETEYEKLFQQFADSPPHRRLRNNTAMLGIQYDDSPPHRRLRKI